jgi:prolyl-tRNA synthetase
MGKLDIPKSDFGRWWNAVLLEADIVDVRTPTKGANVLMPNGYEIWEAIKANLNQRFKKTHHKNAYFPLFIPEEFLLLEEEHFEGFVPEVAWVTHVGDKKLHKKFALRPTSETIMYYMYALWIRSHKDLPLKINQWCNIIRWDTKETQALLRDREFQWSEAHTCHATAEEAVEQVEESMVIYSGLFEDLCLSYLKFKRPPHDTFPGAIYSIAYDAPLSDGKCLQLGTTHNLGQGFSRVFNIKFQKEDGSTDLVYQTCYGLSTRVIAAIVAMHGDDKGLIIPPFFAPTQVVIVPILFRKNEEEVAQACSEIEEQLVKANYNVYLDDRNRYTAGWKFNEHEMRGVPLRIEVGPKDIENNQCLFVRRDTGEKISIKREDLLVEVNKVLHEIDIELRKRTKKLLEDSIHEAISFDELVKTFKKHRGFVKTNWCGDEECAKKIKDELAAEIRGVRVDIDEETVFGSCVVCEEEAKEVVYIGAAY